MFVDSGTLIAKYQGAVQMALFPETVHFAIPPPGRGLKESGEGDEGDLRILLQRAGGRVGEGRRKQGLHLEEVLQPAAGGHLRAHEGVGEEHEVEQLADADVLERESPARDVARCPALASDWRGSHRL